MLGGRVEVILLRKERSKRWKRNLRPQLWRIWTARALKQIMETACNDQE